MASVWSMKFNHGVGTAMACQIPSQRGIEVADAEGLGLLLGGRFGDGELEPATS